MSAYPKRVIFSAILTQIEIPSPKACNSISGKCFKYNLHRNIQNLAFFLEEICSMFVVGIMGFLSASSLSSGSARSWSSGLGIGVSVGRSVGSSVVIRFQGFGFVANLWAGGKFGKRVKAVFGIFGR